MARLALMQGMDAGLISHVHQVGELRFQETSNDHGMRCSREREVSMRPAMSTPAVEVIVHCMASMILVVPHMIIAQGRVRS
ncbi:uncharacterized protein MYCFIDRAFT_180599 [Pseudocercospora fijiensis CIRAD86]|uniref:Uncharacterized protein n=1 Tax=Pseudocercospora fijiensis (strain CIRAD86) TaxID=383855 RepID=M3AIB4_PSEFD|nr:uncharacterized protein MYCFIDRAFT_180599 [Pseudocercospora fijiensis CIRAD86]EME76948.1 hypothetical protein MYCFIDRAFT_180599 [Pseudocercospora fijiensis CIRAD86]